MKNIKIGNIEYKQNGKFEEIVLWFPNKYFDCEENNKRLLSEGYTRDADGGWINDNIHIHKSCTEGKESCYVIAFIEWNNAHDEFDVRSCGTRAFDLEENDYRDFKNILKLIGDYIR